MINLFVSNLDYGVTTEDLTSFFREYGKVIKVTIPTDKETGKPRGFAFVNLVADDASPVVAACNGKRIKDRAIMVKEAEDRRDASNRSSDGRNSGNSSRGERSFNSRSQAPSRSNDNRESRQHTNSSYDHNQDEIQETSHDINPMKVDRKKDKKEKSKPTNNSADGPRKGKMKAYKKSGKDKFHFYEDDDDLDDIDFEY